MDFAGIIYVIIFVIAIAFCCLGDNDSSNTNTTGKKYTPPQRRSSNRYYGSYSYSECPSCGAPGFDGYCEDCGYPDVNQGWLGEEYG